MNEPRFAVCPECGGTGTDFDSAIEFTADDLYEQYGPHGSYERDEFDRAYKSGAYDTICQFCHGDKVVKTARLKEWEELAEMRYEMAQEARWGI